MSEKGEGITYHVDSSGNVYVENKTCFGKAAAQAIDANLADENAKSGGVAGACTQGTRVAQKWWNQKLSDNTKK